MKPLFQQFSETTFDEMGHLIGFTPHYKENFNFAYDVVDVIADTEPDKRAVQWCDENGNEKMLTFGDISRLSSQAGSFLLKQGIQKGDRVLLILKRHYEYWYLALALHKIGAVTVPATYMLRTDDIIYRINSAKYQGGYLCGRCGFVRTYP